MAHSDEENCEQDNDYKNAEENCDYTACIETHLATFLFLTLIFLLLFHNDTATTAIRHLPAYHAVATANYSMSIQVHVNTNAHAKHYKSASHYKQKHDHRLAAPFL